MYARKGEVIVKKCQYFSIKWIRFFYRYIVHGTRKRGPLTAKKRSASFARSKDDSSKVSEERAKMVKSKKLRLLVLEPPSASSSSTKSDLPSGRKKARKTFENDKTSCTISGIEVISLKNLQSQMDSIRETSTDRNNVPNAVRKSSRLSARIKVDWTKSIPNIEKIVTSDVALSKVPVLIGKTDPKRKKTISRKSAGNVGTVLSCHHCEYTCYRKATMSKHMLTCHLSNETDGKDDLNQSVLFCALCPKTFAHKTNLRKHVFSHTLVAEDDPVNSDTKVKKGFCCDICNRGFNNQRDMMAHRDIVHNMETPLTWMYFCKSSAKVKYCDTCNKYFRDGKRFSDHKCVKGDPEEITKQIQRLLDSSPSYQCDVCSLCFHWKWMYRSHRENAHPAAAPIDWDTLPKTEISIYCPSCLKAFEDEQMLTSHTPTCIVNRDNKVKEFVCGVCGRTFSRKSDFQRHLRVKHADLGLFDADRVPPKKKSEIQCPYCDTLMLTRNSILSHIKDVHNIEMDTPFVCVPCNKVFKRKATMDTHNKIYHPKEENVEETNKILKEAEFLLDGETAYHCNVCNRNVQDSLKFLAHYRLHNFERKFTCDLCGKQTRTQHQLNTHVKIIHLDIRNFKCDICQKGFHSKQSCEEHRRIHTGERPFSCEICGKTFIAMNALFTHKKFHNDFFAHPCSMCPKKFKVRRSLINHIRTHTGERPFKCDLCPKTFNNSSRFSYHKKVTHSDNRPFTCDECGSCFKAKKFLMRHMKLHSIRTHIQFRRRNNPAYFANSDANDKKPKPATSSSSEKFKLSPKIKIISYHTPVDLKSAAIADASGKCAIRRITCNGLENIQLDDDFDPVDGSEVLIQDTKDHFLTDAFAENSNDIKFNAEHDNDILC